MSKSLASPPLDGLFDLACRDGVDIRPTLLRVLTDLYVQKATHTAYEETQYVELALGLIQSVDAATRAAVAASLRDYPAAPAAVLNALAVQRPEPAPPDELIELFFAASSDERRLILANLDVVSGTRVPPIANAHATAAALEAAALQRQSAAFARTLVRDLGLEQRLADRIVHDASGEALVIIAKAIGMKAAVLHRILLFLNPAIGQSVERVYELADLFETLPGQVAAHMLSMWSKPAARRPTAHAPLLYDDERRRARPAPSARQGESTVQPGRTTKTIRG